MHNFNNAYNLVDLALLLTVSTMLQRFRDITAEGTVRSNIALSKGCFPPSCILFFIFNLNIAKAIPKEDVKKALDIYKGGKNNNYKLYVYNNCNNNNFGYYVAGLLEGDGHIYIHALGTSTLNRVLNPRIVFTSHVDNLPLYS